MTRRAMGAERIRSVAVEQQVDHPDGSTRRMQGGLERPLADDGVGIEETASAQRGLLDRPDIARRMHLLEDRTIDRRGGDAFEAEPIAR